MAATSGRLEGLVAVITGAASGIGEATAKSFVKHGAKVVVADRQVELGEAVVQELGPSAIFVKCDVTKEEDIKATVDAAVQKFGRLDIMFNNAGIVGERGPIQDAHVAEFDHTLAVNLRSVFLGTKHASRVMKEQKSGCILNTASVAALQGGFGPHGYAASKAAIVGLTRNAAADLHSSCIRVNAILPGGVVTPLIHSLGGPDAPKLTDEQLAAGIADRMGFGGRAIMPDDVANLAVFLASSEAYFITGQSIVIDGGLTGLFLEAREQWFEKRQELLREGGNLGIPTEDS